MSDRRGFTLIELLAVVTIIGVLASIAVPRYSYLKQRAYIASMLSDLHNLVSAEEAFYSVNGDYAGGITPGAEVPGMGGSGRATLLPSPGVVITVTWHSSNSKGEGWSAVATHPGVTDPSRDECGVFVGDPSYSPSASVTRPGVITCY